MSKLKEEKIIVQIGEETIELTGVEKEAFLEQRAKDQADLQIRQAQLEQVKQVKVAAYTKLGLTEEEINAIL
jgi:hypothetical protein